MAKNKTVYVCNECGHEESKWTGKCPACNSWNTFFEQKIVESKSSNSKYKENKIVEAQMLSTFVANEDSRTSTGFLELDRVLGGGIVKGSLILLRRRTWYR